MCGICGIYDKTGSPVDPILLHRMAAVLGHRGPDGEGKLLDREIGLGHKRLSIIDLAGGSQPIGNEDDRLKIIYNGEIYNYIELRKELEGLRHRFKTASDTEVIVHAYEEWGKACVERFIGMFAFALWDARERELFLARDHLGIKPLYFTQKGERVLFASEIKALLQDPECTREVDLDALAQLLMYRYVPSPRTIFKGIQKLKPGHWMRLSRQGIRVERYWKWIPQVREKINEAELVEEYRTLVEDAIRLQLRSDVSLGLFLSSGVDSGAILAIMSKYLEKPVQTFTIGFQEGEETNEIEDARALSDEFGSEHHFKVLTPKDYINFYESNDYFWTLEEPVGHEQAAAFYFLSRLTCEKVKVALSGQGADEPWAGYSRYLGVKFSKLYSKLPESITSVFSEIIGHIPGRFEKLRRGVRSLGEKNILKRFINIYSIFNPEMQTVLFGGELAEIFKNRNKELQMPIALLQQEVSHLDPVSQMLYIDTRTSLPDDLLMVCDKMSMANSLEVRVPFLDHRLVEFAESLPANLKLKKLRAKHLHKEAIKEWLPLSAIDRKKKGFDMPLGKWLRSHMWSYVHEVLFSPASSVMNYFDLFQLKKILDADRSKRDTYERHIFLLLTFELWHRAFIANK